MNEIDHTKSVNLFVSQRKINTLPQPQTNSLSHENIRDLKTVIRRSFRFNGKRIQHRCHSFLGV